MAKTYNLFASHSWTYQNQYDGLVKLLENRPYFNFKNYSVPEDDPIHNAQYDWQLYEAIKKQISPCHVVIVLAGVYSTYSKWINKEIKIANEEFAKKKPILAVEPWGAERTSSIVKNNADLIVGWRADSVVAAIRKLGG